MNDLTKQLQSKIIRSKEVVDLNQVYKRTVNNLTGGKARNFGNIGSIKRVSDNLASEIEEVSTNGLVDVAEAQLVKQGAGTKGAWVYGSADPDASAVEKVYTAFYRELRKEIEQKASPGIREVNQQLSELIPIMNSVIRRIPVAERNNAFSLTDVLSLGFGALNPSAFALAAVNKLSKSGRVGAFLAEKGERLAKRKIPKTRIGERIFGR